MATDKIIKEAASQLFTQRVAFLALRVAQAVAGDSPDAENRAERADYAAYIFRGEEKILLLTLHVVVASDAITAALDGGSAADVKDEDIEAALESIWDARALAFGAVSMQLQKAQRLVDEVWSAVQVAKDAAFEAQEAVTSLKTQPQAKATKKE